MLLVAAMLPLAPLIATSTELLSTRDTLNAAIGQRFVENIGQWPSEIRFSASARGARIEVTRDGVEIISTGENSQENAFGFRPDFGPCLAKGLGADRIALNFSLGNDPNRWVSNAPVFSELLLRSESSDRQMLLRFNEAGSLTFDICDDDGFRATEGAIGIEFFGIAALEESESGMIRLVSETGRSIGTLTAPTAYSVASDGTRRPTSSWFDLVASNKVIYRVARNQSGRTVIDPDLSWSWLLGSALGFNEVLDLTTTMDGRILVAGDCEDSLFPATPGSFDTTFQGAPFPEPNADGFVAELKPDGSGILFATFIGGSHVDQMTGVCSLPDGKVALAGWTDSADYPITAGAYQGSKKGLEGVVSVLDKAGAHLSASTFFGGSGGDFISSVAYDGSDNGSLVVFGFTYGPAFPTTPGAFDTTPGNPWDFFVSKIAIDGKTLLRSTLLGNNGFDSPATGLAVSPNGNIAVCGTSGNSGGTFPLTSGSLTCASQSQDPCANGMLAVFKSDLSGLVASMLCDGASGDVAFGPDGDLYLVGHAYDDFPITPYAVDDPPTTSTEGAFIARLDPKLTTYRYATVLGHINDVANDVVVDGLGCAIVTGATNYAFFPTSQGCFDPIVDDGIGFYDDGFVLRMAPDGREVWYSTFLGGSITDRLNAVAMLPSGGVVVAGAANSGNFPGAVNPGSWRKLWSTAPVAVLQMTPDGAERVGLGTDCGDRRPSIGVNHRPAVGDASLAVFALDGPKSETGWLLTSASLLGTPASLAGVDLYVSPVQSQWIPISTNGAGAILHPLHVHHAPPGTHVALQFVFHDKDGPLGFSATNALDLTMRP